MNNSKLTRPYFIAQSLLSIIPAFGLNKNTGTILAEETPSFSDDELEYTALFYPLIGLVIGVFLWLTALLLSSSSALLGAVLITVIWVIVTGFKHLRDLVYLADTYPTLKSSSLRNSDEKLMGVKQASLGAYGMIVMMMVLLLKVVTVDILIQHNSWSFLLFIPMLARGAMLGFMVYSPVSTHSSDKYPTLCQRIKELLNIDYAQAILFLMGIVSIFTLGVMPLLLVIGLIMLFRYAALKYYSGVNDVVLSASVELMEIACLLFLALSVA